jgi:hypothetical protein
MISAVPARQYAKPIFISLAIAGGLLLFDFLQTSSETGNQFLLGLSKTRFFVALVFSLLVLINLGVVVLISTKRNAWRAAVEHRFTAWLLDYPIPIFIVLYLAAVTTGIWLLILIPPGIRMFAVIETVGGQMTGLLIWLFLASSLVVVFFRTTRDDFFRGNRVILALDRFLLLLAIFTAIFFLYQHILIWTGAANQSRYSYWNLLADEFLKGRLYLTDPPQTHDLTLYHGKWYVPMPPLPAVLMMPLAYLIGGENINTSDFSILLSAINAVLVFLILEQMAAQKWIKLSKAGLLLMIVLFAFGNPHLWVGIRGRAWFVSQIVTVTFLALAVFATLKSWSPWLVGISIGCAVATRPNGIMTWPFVFAIAMQILKEKNGTIDLKQILNWSVRSGLPIVAAIMGLLLYNYARFEKILDFGYVTISGDPTIVTNAQTFGIFSPHYILANLKAMLFYLPAIQPGGQWPILPSSTGMSIFLVTPPLIYLFHRYERQWWILGAWTSVLLNFLLLVLYHNTGAHQFGYRYILDAIIPLLALLAAALGQKIRWHFVLLLLISIAFNIYGTYWFING